MIGRAQQIFRTCEVVYDRIISYHKFMRTRLEPPTSPEAKAALEASLRYQDELRAFAVWVYDDPFHIGYPRFVAVIEDKRTFNGFRKRGEGVRKTLETFERPTRWLPTFRDEVWQHATLSINVAYSSRLLAKSPDTLELKPVRPEDWEEKEATLKTLLPHILELPGVRSVKLKAKETFNAYGYPVIQPLLVLRSRPGSLSYRRLSGRAFRLRGLTRGLEERPHHKLGILVLRGLEREVEVVDRDRKKREDAKTQRVFIEADYELVGL
jgi:hypothetical protein